MVMDLVKKCGSVAKQAGGIGYNLKRYIRRGKAMINNFKGRHFSGEIILFCVRWYLQTPLSYQQVADLVTERGFKVHKTTVWRWVQCYAPKLKKKLAKYLKMSTTVHHFDETYIKVKGKQR